MQGTASPGFVRAEAVRGGPGAAELVGAGGFGGKAAALRRHRGPRAGGWPPPPPLPLAFDPSELVSGRLPAAPLSPGAGRWPLLYPSLPDLMGVDPQLPAEPRLQRSLGNADTGKGGLCAHDVCPLSPSPARGVDVGMKCPPGGPEA